MAHAEMTPELATALVVFLGFAIQRGVELVVGVVELKWTLGKETKAAVCGALATLVGCGICLAADFDLLHLMKATEVNGIPGQILTGFVVAAGTDGANAVTKFVNYAKDAKRRESRGESQDPSRPPKG